ncbi:hypothetical protein LG322_11930 [Microbacterium aerolatum]|uniref:lipopolysaccharide biosynthesis protein n=1 Tax=Microbacterium aerolatum TaxID=153731 RepID=UPI00384E7149
MFSRPTYTGSAEERLARKSILALISRSAPGAATLAVNVMIGRLGGAALLGTTQSAMSTASLLALLYPTPASSAASKFVAATNARALDDHNASAIAASLARRVAVVALILAVGVAIVYTVLHPGDIVLPIVSAIMVIGISMRTLMDGLHFGAGLTLRLSAWSALIALFGTLATALLLVIGVRSAWVITPLAFSNLIFAVVSWPRRSAGRVPAPLRAEIRTFITLGVVGTLASAGFAQATVLVNAAVNGLAFTGKYAGALTLTTPIALISSALAAVLFPALAASFQSADRGAVRARVLTTTRLLATLLVPVLFVFTLLSDTLVSLVWGEGFTETRWIMLFLVPSVICTAIASPSVSALTARSNQGMFLSTVASLIGTVAGIAVWLIFIPISPELAVPAGYATGVFLIAAIPWCLTWRTYKMPWLGETLLVVSMILTAVGLSAYLQITDRNFFVALAACLILTSAWVIVRRRDFRRIRTRFSR